MSTQAAAQTLLRPSRAVSLVASCCQSQLKTPKGSPLTQLRSRGNRSISYNSSNGTFSTNVHPPLTPPPSSGVARLTSRRLISVSGPDAVKYLQGVITANIHKKDDTGQYRTGFYSGFLNAQGRVLHDVFIYRDTLSNGHVATRDEGDAAFLVEVDADEAATLEKHIRRYKLRSKFAVRLLEADEMSVWHAWGGGAAAVAEAVAGTGANTAGGNGGSSSSSSSSGSGSGSPEGDVDVSAVAIRMADSRAPSLGWRYVTPTTAATASLASPPPALALQLDAVDESAYRLHRYLLGVAEGQREILRGQALPLESNMDLMGGIDFHKGCYVGQELTIRTRHRGVVRKRILPCILYPDDDGALASSPSGIPSYYGNLSGSVPPESNISRVGKKGRSAGKWLAGVGNVGLALCRLETMTDVVLPEDAVAAAPAQATDSKALGEFVIQWTPEPAVGAEKQGGSGGAVRVKAFVPDWVRKGLAPAE